MMATLLPCPFCGEAPEMEPWHGGKPTKQMVSCVNDACAVLPQVTGETPALAAEAWNQRPTPSAPVAAEPGDTMTCRGKARINGGGHLMPANGGACLPCMPPDEEVARELMIDFGYDVTNATDKALALHYVRAVAAARERARKEEG